MSYADYKKLVTQEFIKKGERGDLALNLLDPTPKQLKEECLLVCSERYLRKDENVLRQFFGQGGDRDTFLKAIEKFDLDKFKPLINYLKKNTNTSEKNIELLAWLIDFEHRPFELGKRYPVEMIGNLVQHEDVPTNVESKAERTSRGHGEQPMVSLEVSEEEGSINGDEELPTKTGLASTETVEQLVRSVRPFKLDFRTGLIGGLAIVLIFLMIGIFWMRNGHATPTGPQGCMYWDGDHYEPVSCNVRLGDTLSLALDPDKVDHFKMVTNTDTITEASVGALWYVKYNGKIEFYTSGGYHPLDPQLRLKPLTVYIVRKYVHHVYDGEPLPQ